MEMSGHLHTSVTLPPVKKSSTHSIGEWVNPRAVLDIFEKRKFPAFAGI
jgi:hypothetical protein